MPPKKLGVSPELKAVIGVQKATRGEITKKVWDYVKKNDLQDPEDKRFIIPDETLAKVLGKNRIHGFKIAKPLQKHIIA